MGKDEGAALLEFAFVAPVLFLLVFGIMEFGWAFFQNLDVRHGARETARLAAVADPATTAAIVTEACTRMEAGDFDIVIDFQGTDVGDEVLVTVQKSYNSLTKALDFATGHISELRSTVSIRLEQPAPAVSFPDEPDEGSYTDCP